MAILYLAGLPNGLAQELESKGDVVGTIEKLQRIDTPAACALRGTLQAILVQLDASIQSFERAERLVLRQPPSFEREISNYGLKVIFGTSLLCWGFEGKVRTRLEDACTIPVERLEQNRQLAAFLRGQRRLQAVMAIRTHQSKLADELVHDLLDISDDAPAEERADYIACAAAVHYSKGELDRCGRELDHALETVIAGKSLVQRLLVLTNLLAANWCMKRTGAAQQTLEELESTAAPPEIRTIVLFRASTVFRRSRHLSVLALN